MLSLRVSKIQGINMYNKFLKLNSTKEMHSIILVQRNYVSILFIYKFLKKLFCNLERGREKSIL